MAASLPSLFWGRGFQWRDASDAVFLLGLAAVFVIQLLEGVAVVRNPADAGTINTIAVLVIVCFLVGIARAWELIGGPAIGITREVKALIGTGKERRATSER